jgi:hypothetical protein
MNWPVSFALGVMTSAMVPALARADFLGREPFRVLLREATGWTFAAGIAVVLAGWIAFVLADRLGLVSVERVMTGIDAWVLLSVTMPLALMGGLAGAACDLPPEI